MYIDKFKSMVTTTKRNHIYYGPTESRKVASTLEEISVDLNTVYTKMDAIKDKVDALASGFLLPSGCDILPSGYDYNIRDLRARIYMFEENLNKRIYVEADQGSVT